MRSPPRPEPPRVVGCSSGRTVGRATGRPAAARQASISAWQSLPWQGPVPAPVRRFKQLDIGEAIGDGGLGIAPAHILARAEEGIGRGACRRMRRWGGLPGRLADDGQGNQRLALGQHHGRCAGQDRALAGLHLQLIARLAEAEDEKIARLQPGAVETHAGDATLAFGGEERGAGEVLHIRRGKIAGAGDPGEGLSGRESIGGRFGVGEDADAPGFRDCSGCGQALEGAQADDAGEIIAGEARQAVIGAGGDDEFLEGEGDRTLGADEKRLARLLVEADAGRAEEMRQSGTLRLQLGQLRSLRPLEARAAAEGVFRFDQQHIAAGFVMRQGRGHAGDAAAHDQHLAAAIAPLAGDGRQASRQGGRGGEAAQALEVELA